MILFFAGSENSTWYKILKEHKVKNYLISFFYCKKIPKVIHEVTKDRKIFIDSGGFSARRMGVEIKVEQYIDFLNSIKDKYYCCANLDTAVQKETLLNERKLEKAGLDFLPVYHFSDFNTKYRYLLDDYIKKYDHIAIGGVAKVYLNKEQVTHYLNYVFNKTRDKVKVHGFGITSVDLLKKYPFFSVDSTSYQQASRYGCINAYKNLSTSKLMGVRAGKNKIKSAKQFLPQNEKLSISINTMLRIEEEITKLWKLRGIKWTNLK